MKNPYDSLRSPWTIHAADRPWLLGIVILATFLRFFRIGQQSFWADEVFSVWSITRPEHGLLTYFHGPLHSALLHFWSIWGGFGDVWARGLSATIGILTIPLIYLLARSLLDNRAGLIAAFLLAISPMHVWYAQEVRYPELLIGLAVLSQFLFHQLLERESRGRWAAFFLVSIGLILSNFAGAFLIAAQGLILLLTRPSMLLRFVPLQILVLATLWPWLSHYQSGWSPALVGQADIVRHTNFHPLAIPWTFAVYSIGDMVGPSRNEMNTGLSAAQFLPHLWYFIPVALLYAFLFGRGLMLRFRKEKGLVFFLCWLLLPIALTAILSTLNVKVYAVRYTAVALPAYLLILAAALNLRSALWRSLLLLAVTAACALPLSNHYFAEQYMKPDARGAAAWLEKSADPDDAIWVYSIGEPFEYYYDGEAAWELLPWGLPETDERLDAFMSRAAAISDRAWLVDYRAWYLDPHGRLAARFDAEWDLVETRNFVGMNVKLYAKPHRAQGN